MQVRTQAKTVMHKGRVWVMVETIFEPEGSGNRHIAERVAAAVRKKAHIQKHIKRVTHTTSRVKVYIEPSSEAMLDWAKFMVEEHEKQRRSRDVPGQMLIPGVQ